MSWQQPDEKSIAALEHGMLFADGVEVDGAGTFTFPFKHF